MANSMKKNYKISGSGFLSIDGDAIIIAVEDKDLAAKLDAARESAREKVLAKDSEISARFQ